ncbi:MAG: CoA-transferase [Advenella sp.]|uniref:3-oxoadipate CoA-transferase n=1 Tax=Advenella kashmirensis TaxID=310575 RepID=A0A356LLP9_9BURK|nr:3-oxoadipate CoA-transferase [Advenella kashmirensis]
MSEWQPVSREHMARRVAQDVFPGAVVNLGIGMPELVGNYFAAQDEIIVHTENGIVGSGPIVDGSLQDFDLINAGRKTVSLVCGGHFVDHVDSFALVRGGHLDITILGAFEVSASGDLANWSTGADANLPSPGGAMDLVVGARSVFVMMNLFGKNQQARLVEQCTLPLTGARVVKRLYTDLAVFELSGAVPTVLELTPGTSLDALSRRLGLSLQPAPAGIGNYSC